jgi:hypothetical protein
MKRELTLEVLEDRTVPSVVAATFADGLWRHDTVTGNWAHLSTDKATDAAVDDTGNVFAKFSSGVWRWTFANGVANVQLLSNLNLAEMEVTAGGVLYGSFANQGLWRWSNAGWQKLSDFNPYRAVVSDSDALFARFDTGVVGTWRWTPQAGWAQLSAARPDGFFATDDGGNFVGNFNVYIGTGQQGTWRWTPAGGWTRLSTVVAKVTASDTGTVFETRGAAGMWAFNPNQPSAGFQRISDANAFSPIPTANGAAGIFYNSTTSHYELWHYTATSGWALIDSNLTADGLAVGSGEDLFLARGDKGLWMWSATTGYTKISADTAKFVASQGIVLAD